MGYMRFGILDPIANLLTTGLFLWSVYWAYVSTGLVAALLTFFLPIVGQCYWAFMLWPSIYSFLFVGIIAFFLLEVILGIIAERLQ
jgi:hypothetical protein